MGDSENIWGGGLWGEIIWGDGTELEMATVADIHKLFRSLLIKGRIQTYLHDELAVLNEAKWQVWKILTSVEGDDNWFVNILEAQSFLTTQKVYTLPADFAQMREIEVTAPDSYKTVRFWNPKLDSHRYTEGRRSNDTSATEIPYTIIGANPGQLVLSKPVPADLTATFWYVAKPADWTAMASNIDDMPRIAWMPIARYAAAMILIQSGARVRFGDFHQLFRDEIMTMAQGPNRVNDQPEVAHGWMEA